MPGGDNMESGGKQLSSTASPARSAQESKVHLRRQATMAHVDGPNGEGKSECHRGHSQTQMSNIDIAKEETKKRQSCVGLNSRVITELKLHTVVKNSHSQPTPSELPLIYFFLFFFFLL